MSMKNQRSGRAKHRNPGNTRNVARETESHPASYETVHNWDGIGAVLGVSYMTAKRWARKDKALARIVRVFRENFDPRMGCKRRYVFAFRSDLEAYLRARPAIHVRGNATVESDSAR